MQVTTCARILSTVEQPLPPPMSPMLATAGEPIRREGWQLEIKWDGWRAIMRLAGTRIAIDSRTGNALLGIFPELADLPDAVDGRVLTLDGELVAFDEAGVPRFERLQQRIGPRTSARRRGLYPVVFVAFDLLNVDGESTLRLPWSQRRALLDDLAITHPRVQLSPAWPATDLDALLRVARDRGYEGVVAKRTASRYEPGHRSQDWVKHAFRLRTEVVVGGWRPGQGGRSATLGALLVGAHDETGEMVFLGKVGTGFNAAALRQLGSQLGDLEQPTSPFSRPIPREDARGAHWVRPELVGEVEYRELSSDHRLRQPSWRGQRLDYPPDAVRLPQGATQPDGHDR